MDIVFLGPPGAGKGTQAHRLADSLGVPWLSTGAVLRRAVAEGTPTGVRAKALMDAGHLVPDDVLADLVRESLARPESGRGVVFDGYPRNDAQAETLDGLLGAAGRRVDLALVVEVPEEVIVRRLSGRRSCPRDGAVYHVETARPRNDGRCDGCGGVLVQRDDDRPETLRERLAVYREHAAGLEARYERAGVLVRVDGASGSPERVFARVREAAGAGTSR